MYIERKVNNLNEATSSSDFNVTTEDCEALFPNQPVTASDTMKECICLDGTFIKNNTCCMI